MQKISVNLRNDCDENQLNYDNDLPEIGNKNYTTETFRNRFFDSNRQRKTSTVIHHLLSSPRQPITFPYSTEYWRNMSEIFPNFHCK